MTPGSRPPAVYPIRGGRGERGVLSSISARSISSSPRHGRPVRGSRAWTRVLKASLSNVVRGTRLGVPRAGFRRGRGSDAEQRLKLRIGSATSRRSPRRLPRTAEGCREPEVTFVSESGSKSRPRSSRSPCPPESPRQSVGGRGAMGEDPREFRDFRLRDLRVLRGDSRFIIGRKPSRVELPLLVLTLRELRVLRGDSRRSRDDQAPGLEFAVDSTSASLRLILGYSMAISGINPSPWLSRRSFRLRVLRVLRGDSHCWF
jgi:hypothetical protein